jgi:2-desacetyl-2-hydroxyethyl bacteriochlorophyllide A dehydrogenase
MEGIMFTAKGRAELIDEPTPQCKPGHMLMRTIYSGLSNGTERSFLMGGPYSAPYPSRLAYQHVSEVIEVGQGITRFAVGDILYSATYPGHVEYHLLKETDLVVKLPRGCDLQAAALLGVAAVSFHDAQRAAVRPQDKVLVFGAGLIGQFAAQASRIMGAHVTVVDRQDDRLAMAKQLGADVVVNTAAADGDKVLQAAKPFSVIFECSGGDVLGQIIGKREGEPGLIARRSHARLVLVAGRFRVEYDFTPAGGAELDILHTQHFDQCDLDQALRLFLRGDLKTRPLIRDLVPLAEAPAIFDRLRDQPGGLLGTVFSVGAVPRDW